MPHVAIDGLRHLSDQALRRDGDDKVPGPNPQTGQCET
ncbi:hypothetical protein SAMCFNEI73_Ch0080 [Sinorhizobium americanum]|uniref:Uncharacterized protein n=1 Tax=Sinorhizobium americanum TaxID=194963 RepID=A0A1L3LH84_9HYPH|nr:hypothetical protein SAMCCGM7_Ch0080 [Sinorhizobium americanum CCGM7]APG89416.1 hypothetical protein SAMCFNEI73_Ch0080 [Sinorhizobium americanum]